MRTNLTDITVVLDRSGSMQLIRADAEGGLNSFIESQKRDVGEALFSLVQFDGEYEFVHKGVQIKDVPHCTLVPRGSTSLFDALGRAINETGERLAAMSEAERPGLVVFVVITDGMENSSKEFNRQQIHEMISRQEKDYAWKFTYLGANQDAFAVGQGMAVNVARCANYDHSKSPAAFAAAGMVVSRGRAAMNTGLYASADCAEVDDAMEYTAAEHKEMKE